MYSNQLNEALVANFMKMLLKNPPSRPPQSIFRLLISVIERNNQAHGLQQLERTIITRVLALKFRELIHARFFGQAFDHGMKVGYLIGW